MRNVEAIQKFMENQKGKASSVTSTGDKLYHYNTVMAQRVSWAFVINTTYYSPTTKAIQTAIMDELPTYMFANRIEVDNIPRNTQDLSGYVNTILHRGGKHT